MDLALTRRGDYAVRADAGLAEARAGRDGGYRLTRPPAEVPLLDVVEAAEGTFTLERCILRGGPCHWEQACAVHAAWSAAVQACRDSLGRTTLADLVAADVRLEAGGGMLARGLPPA